MENINSPIFLDPQLHNLEAHLSEQEKSTIHAIYLQIKEQLLPALSKEKVGNFHNVCDQLVGVLKVNEENEELVRKIKEFKKKSQKELVRLLESHRDFLDKEENIKTIPRIKVEGKTIDIANLGNPKKNQINEIGACVFYADLYKLLDKGVQKEIKEKYNGGKDITSKVVNIPGAKEVLRKVLEKKGRQVIDTKVETPHRDFLDNEENIKTIPGIKIEGRIIDITNITSPQQQWINEIRAQKFYAYLYKSLDRDEQEKIEKEDNQGKEIGLEIKNIPLAKAILQRALEKKGWKVVRVETPHRDFLDNEENIKTIPGIKIEGRIIDITNLGSPTKYFINEIGADIFYAHIYKSLSIEEQEKIKKEYNQGKDIGRQVLNIKLAQIILQKVLEKKGRRVEKKDKLESDAIPHRNFLDNEENIKTIPGIKIEGRIIDITNITNPQKERINEIRAQKFYAHLYKSLDRDEQEKIEKEDNQGQEILLEITNIPLVQAILQKALEKKGWEVVNKSKGKPVIIPHGIFLDKEDNIKMIKGIKVEGRKVDITNIKLRIEDRSYQINNLGSPSFFANIYKILDKETQEKIKREQNGGKDVGRMVLNAQLAKAILQEILEKKGYEVINERANISHRDFLDKEENIKMIKDIEIEGKQIDITELNLYDEEKRLYRINNLCSSSFYANIYKSLDEEIQEKIKKEYNKGSDIGLSVKNAQLAKIILQKALEKKGWVVENSNCYSNKDKILHRDFLDKTENINKISGICIIDENKKIIDLSRIPNPRSMDDINGQSANSFLINIYESLNEEDKIDIVFGRKRRLDAIQGQKILEIALKKKGWTVLTTENVHYNFLDKIENIKTITGVNIIDIEKKVIDVSGISDIRKNINGVTGFCFFSNLYDSLDEENKEKIVILKRHPNALQAQELLKICLEKKGRTVKRIYIKSNIEIISNQTSLEEISGVKIVDAERKIISIANLDALRNIQINRIGGLSFFLSLYSSLSSEEKANVNGGLPILGQINKKQAKEVLVILLKKDGRKTIITEDIQNNFLDKIENIKTIPGVRIIDSEKIIDLSRFLPGRILEINGVSQRYFFKNIYLSLQEMNQKDINIGKESYPNSKQSKKILGLALIERGRNVIREKNVSFLDDNGNISTIPGVKIIDSEKKIIDISQLISPQRIDINEMNGLTFFSKLYDLLSEDEKEKINIGKRTPRTLEAQKILKLILEKKGRTVLSNTNSLETCIQSFSTEITQNTESPSEDLHQIDRLLSLFGSNNIVDILYQYHPEYKGIPVTHAKKIIGEYLGDFLMQERPFFSPNLRFGLNLLSGEKKEMFTKSLTEVSKKHILSSYDTTKKEQPTMKDQEIVEKSLNEFYNQIKEFITPELQAVYDVVKEYYNQVLTVFDSQEHQHIISKVDTTYRNFPDFYQKINIVETQKKKRILIADEMGLGKTGSAILSKETLRCKQALVLAPTNVLETWKQRLADGKDPQTGKQLGYFVAGQSPKVAVLDSTTREQDLSEYDYVLFSHEMCGNAENNPYINKILEMHPDMLIVDEIHQFKNITSGSRSQNLLKLQEQIEQDDNYLVLLSGTPIPNKVTDVALYLKLLVGKEYAQVDVMTLVDKIITADALDLRSELLQYIQQKKIQDHLTMPDKSEETIHIHLSENEQELYKIILEQDDIPAMSKLMAMRKFLLNPASVGYAPNMLGSKITKLNNHLNQRIQSKDKIVVFVNDYMEDVLRGEKNILQQIDLGSDVRITQMHGKTPKQERSHIENNFNKKPGKEVLFVSGDIAGLGIDLTAAQEVVEYNEPWTQAEKDQQIARAYRSGLQHDVHVTTLITPDTIEEGIHTYIASKQKAINKLLQGIPVSEIEAKWLRKDSNSSSTVVESDSELAKFYLSNQQQLSNIHKIFAKVKGIGESQRKEFLDMDCSNAGCSFGEIYAQIYNTSLNRGYQANANRVVATIIDRLLKEQGKQAQNVQILDLASGPQMLERRLGNELASQVNSLDINSNHFDATTGKGNIAHGSITQIPWLNKQIDVINCSFALHYMSLEERIKAFGEMNRVLKEGGICTINNLYSLDRNKENELQDMLSLFGFEVISAYSGKVESGSTYQSNLLTLRKVKESESYEEILEIIKDDQDYEKVFAFNKNVTATIKHPTTIISDFVIGGERIACNLHEKDRELLDQERLFKKEVEEVKTLYCGLSHIPSEILSQKGRARYAPGGKPIILKRCKVNNDDGSIYEKGIFWVK